MSTLDYGNLKKRGQEAQQNKGWKPLTEDTFPCVFVGGDKGQTEGRGGKPKLDRFQLQWRINRKSDDFMHKKVLKDNFLEKFDWQMDKFLDTMIELGVDLDKVNGPDDWEDVFDELEEQRVKANIKVYYQDKDKNEDGTIRERAFAEYLLVDVIQGLPADSDWFDSSNEPVSAKEETPEPEAKPEHREEPKVEEKPTEPAPTGDETDEWD